MPINRLQLVTPATTLTSAGAQAGVNAETIVGDYTIKLRIASLSAYVRIVIEEATSFDFSSPKTLVVWNFSPGFTNPEGVNVSFRKREDAGTDIVGDFGTYVRVNVTELNGASPSVTFSCWLEY